MPTTVIMRGYTGEDVARISSREEDRFSTERRDREKARVDFYYRCKARGNAFFLAETEKRQSIGGNVVSRNRAKLFAKHFPRITCNSHARH